MSTKLSFIKPVSRVKLHEEIKNILLKNIIKGEIRPGEKLPTERTLSENLNVNRSTVREALSSLEDLDLIEILHGDGAYVKDYLESSNLELIWELISIDGSIDRNILTTLLEIRRILVPEMAAKAAINRTDNNLKDLEEIIYEKPDLPMIEKDIKVHQILARASNNILYLIMLNFFNKFMRAFGYLYFEDKKNIKRSVLFHEEIYHAIKEKNPEESRRIMREVLLYAENSIQKYLNKQTK